MKFRTRSMSIWVHVLSWTGLFLYPFLFHYLSFDDSRALLRMFLLLLVTMGFFYGNMFILIPKLLGTKKVVLYALSVAASIVLSAVLWGWVEQMLNPNYIHSSSVFEVGVTAGAAISFSAWVISSIMKITQEWFRNEQQRKTAEHERVNAELAFLRSQVNPHFLFNALNNIYALGQKRSADTGPAILRLSELFRYMLYETRTDRIPLEKEVDYLRNYIDLQKLGLSDAVPIVFTVEGDIEGKMIEPMLLIPLVENTFKHGVSYHQGSPIRIRLNVQQNQLELTTENAITPNARAKDGTSGIGIGNLQKRLLLLYPSAHRFDAFADGGKYFTHLKIDLK